MKIIRDLTPLYLHLILFIKFYRPHSTIQIMSLFHITNSPISLLSCLITSPTTAYHITSASPVPPLPCLKLSLLTLLPCLNISCLLCYHVSKRLHPPLLPYLKHPLSTLLPCLKPSHSTLLPCLKHTLSPPLSYFFQFKIPIYATFALPLRIWRI